MRGLSAVVLVVGAGAPATWAGVVHPNLLISQGTTFYRYSAGGVSVFHNIGDVINGMTTVPIGMTVGDMNGGAKGGDILALGGAGVYRVDNAGTTPTLTQVGNRGGPNASPVFVGGSLYGIGGALPDGSVLVQWDTTTFAETNRWATGVFGGPGGLVAVPGTTDEFYYSEFNTDAIWRYKIGDTFSTFVCATPNNDYVGLEMIDGAIYASYALPTTDEFVLGIQGLDGTFQQLALLDSYGDGITGIAQIVPSPTAFAVGAPMLAGLAVRRRRR